MVLMDQLIRMNTPVISCINRQKGARSLPLLKLSHTLLQWFCIYLLSMRATHVPGRQHLCPDLLSRCRLLVRKWRLHSSVRVQIWGLFRKAAVDLLASGTNTHCPLFFSKPDQNALLGVDALAHPWYNVPCMHSLQWKWYYPYRKQCTDRVFLWFWWHLNGQQSHDMLL